MATVRTLDRSSYLRLPLLALAGAALLGLGLTSPLAAQEVEPSSLRTAEDGEGPYERLIIRGATIVQRTPPTRRTSPASSGRSVPVRSYARAARGQP